MTAIEKQRIKYLRGKGESYAAIAAALAISENTVKSYCRRNNLGASISVPLVPASKDTCTNCGLPLIHTSGAKKKRFCSDRCRMAWWNAHPEAVNRKAIRGYTCQTCGKQFTAYGNTERKYCTRVCYAKTKGRAHE